MAKENRTRSAALRFVLIIGVANFFADFTYEGARGVIGPFLGSLGATGAIVGFVAGLGELIGYGLRSVSGYLADRTRRYWLVTFIGYAINMLAVPALALAGNWLVGAGLIIAERTGRAIRKPVVEAMLSHSGKRIGAGWAFGLNEALDQGGAMLGPVIVALVLFRQKSYQNAFGLLLISALICLGIIGIARMFHSDKQESGAAADVLKPSHQSKAYWIYLAAGALIAAGFADFSLIGFHFAKASVVPERAIPGYYAVAMGTGAVGSLFFGRLLDRLGAVVIIFIFLGSAFFAPLVFFGGAIVAFVGMALWGLGMGAQDSLLKAVLAPVISAKQSSAFGLFDTAYGIAWFIGSAVMGLLYDVSKLGLVVFAVLLQLAALPLFVLANQRAANRS
ncbi:MAG TPA: MFS transporter [Chthoniobacterales bacterium]|nr:MFS transporter [Chthoniobacterales bacterium]